MNTAPSLLLTLVVLYVVSVGGATLAQPRASAAPIPSVPVEPIAAILDAVRSHGLVAIGDAHGNQQGEAFQQALVRDPRIAAAVNDIILELGNSRYQDAIDRFVSGAEVPQEVLRRAWQDTTQQQAAPWDMPRIIAVVREVNASLPPERRLRVLLAEPPIDWGTLRTADDLRNWNANPAVDRDRFAAAVIQRELLDRRRTGVALFGAGHFFRKNVTHSLVSLLERDSWKAFTIWTNSVADMAAMQSDVATWPIPSLARIKGTTLGRTPFEAYFGRDAAHIPDEWKGPMEEQFDAVLYLGPPSTITFGRPARWPCRDAAFAERLRRIALSQVKLAERLKQECVP